MKKYILPIISYLFHYNSILKLYKLLQEKMKVNDISIEQFNNIIYKLINRNILEYNLVQEICRYNEIEKKDNSIVIYSFVRPEQLQPVVNILCRNNFAYVRIVYCLPYLIDNFETIDNKFDNIMYEKVFISDVNILQQQLDSINEEVLITVQSSANNILLNKVINKFSIENRIPWLNITITPNVVQVGPFVIDRYLGNFNDFIEIYTNKHEEEVNLYIRENVVKVNEMLHFAYSFLINEINAFFSFKNDGIIPRTFNKVVIFNNRKEIIETIDILKKSN